MAAGFDNDIELTIGLEPSDIKDTAQDVENTVKNIFKFNAGKEFDDSTKKVLSSLSKLSGKSQEIRAEIERLENTEMPTKEYKKYMDTLTKLEPVYERLVAKKERLEQSNMAYGKDYQKLLKQIDTIGGKLDDAKDSMYGLEKAGMDVVNGIDTPKYQKLVNVQSELNNQARILIGRLREQGLAVDESTKVVAKNTPIIQQIVERYKELNAMQSETPKESKLADFEEKMAQRIRKSIDSIQDAIQPKKVAGVGKKFADAILDSMNMETIEQRASGAAKGMRKFANNLLNSLRIENIEAQASKIGEALGNKVVSGMNRTTNSAKQVGQKIATSFHAGMNAVLNAFRMENIENAFDNMRRKVTNAFKATFQVISANVAQSMKNIGAKIKEGLTHPIQSISKMGTTVGNAMQKASKTALPVLTRIDKAASKVVNTLKRIANTAKKTFNNFSKSVASTFKNIRKLATETTKMGKSGEFSFKRLLKTLLAYGIGIRSLYFLFNRLRSAMKEGLSNMAQWRDGANDTNRSISQLMSSLTYLKNAWAAAFAPILNFVAPALSRLIDLLADASNAIGAFFAAITGKNTFIKAKKVMQDYAKSLGKTKDAAKEAREELASYDKLDVIKQDKDKGDDDNGLGNIADMFEEVAIPSKIKEFADLLRQLAKDDKWYEIGAEIAKRLNQGMQVIDDWINNTFRPQGVKWAKRVAEVLNGIVDYLDWELLGKTVADGMNAIADIINTFLLKFNFVNLGKGLGRAVKSWFDNIEWDLIGRTVANGFNAIIDLFYGFMTELEGFGPQIGAYLAEFWNNFMESIHLKRAAKALATAINEFFGVLGGFADANNWNDHAQRVAEAVKLFFESMTWQENGANLTKFLNGLIEYVWQFFTDMQDVWGQIGKGFADFLGELFTGTNFVKAGETLGMALNGIKDLILEFALNFPWEEAGENFGQGIQAFFATTDWAGKGKAANELILGILTFIKSAVEEVDWKGVGQSIGEFLDEIEWGQILGDLFTIIWEVLSGLISGLLDSKSGKVIAAIAIGMGAIKALIAGFKITGIVGKWITDAMPILDKFALLFGNGGPLAGIAAKVGGVLAPVGGAIKTALAGLAGIAKAAIVPVGASILAAVGGWQIGKALSSVLFDDWKEAFDKFSFRELLRALKDTFFGDLDVSWVGFTEYLYDQLSSGGKAMVDGLFSGIQKAFDAVGGILNWLKTNIVDPIVNGFKSLFGIHSPSTVMAEIGNNVIEGMINGIKEKWDGITSFFTEKIPALVNTIKGKWEDLKTATKEKWESVKTAVSGAWGNIKTTLSNPSSITSKIQTAFTGMKTNVSNAWQTLQTKTSTAFSSMKQSMINAFSEAKTKVIGFAENIKTNVSKAWEGLKEKASELYDNMKETGANVAEGLKNGIEKGKEKVKSVGKKVADGLISVVNGEFGVASPSRVFMEIGEYLMEGLTKGIVSEEDGAVDAVKNIADDIQDQFGDERVGLNLDTVSMVDGLDDILNRLTSIANLFTIVTQQINDAANTIDIPDIVKGRIAPGNAAVQGAQTAQNNELRALLENFIAAIGDAEDSSNKEPIVLQLNGKQIAQVVWDEQEKRYKQSNGYIPRFA